jgi:hypothetical protein
LPQELLTRLKLLQNQGNYRDQVDRLSMAFPHKEDAVIRWYLHHKAMPYLHILETYDHGNQMTLYILLPRWRSVLKMQKLYGEWTLESLTPESDVEMVIPPRFRDGEGWMLKHASYAQMAALARQLRVPTGSLPMLTAFNVQALIQSTLLMRHFFVVRQMIAEVENCGTLPQARRKIRAA